MTLTREFLQSEARRRNINKYSQSRILNGSHKLFFLKKERGYEKKSVKS